MSEFDPQTNPVCVHSVSEATNGQAWEITVTNAQARDKGGFVAWAAARENEYMEWRHSVIAGGVFARTDDGMRWKTRAYTLDPVYESEVKENDLKYKVRENKKGWVLEVEGTPGAWRSAKSVILRAYDAGVEIKGGKTALENKIKQANAASVDPYEQAMQAAERMKRWRDLPETQKQAVLDKVNEVMA